MERSYHLYGLQFVGQRAPPMRSLPGRTPAVLTLASSVPGLTMYRRSSGRAVAAVPAVLAVLTAVAAVAPVEYTNQFAVVVAGGRRRAERAAEKHGCTVVDSVRRSRTMATFWDRSRLGP